MRNSAWGRSRMVALVATFWAAMLAFPTPTVAQGQPGAERTGRIEGVVSTQSGSIPLGGAAVGVRDMSDVEIVALATDADGRYRVSDLPPGAYRVKASLDGFSARTLPVVVVAGQTARLDVDLPVAGIAASVDVVAPRPSVIPPTGTLSRTDAVESQEAERLAFGGGVNGTLRLLASVIEVPGGLSIKGGRPNQAGMQIGSSTFTDPSLGLAHINLPDDAIDSVSVLPNPYAVEYGRFSSGLVVIQTRRGGDKWKVRLNNLDPSFRTERHEDWKVTGINAWAPRVEVGGPIVKERMFLEQTAQYRYGTDEIPSRPPDERRTTNALSSFTRIDAILSPRHTLIATAGLFPKVTTYASLGTFTPPDTAVDVHDSVTHFAVVERAVLGDRLVAESTFQADRYRTQLLPQGNAPMEFRTESQAGNFFNTQERTPNALQFVESLSGTYDGPIGLHLFKVGADILNSHYSGISASRPVLIYRFDGTLARRLDYGAPTTQDVTSTDVALFAQDRVQPSTRWFLEGGARLDRDGILGRWNVTPRIGAAVLMNDTGSAVLRGGVGLFYERTPSVAGVFQQFEEATDTRYAADGMTELGPPVRYVHTVATDLATARSATWDVSFDYRINPRWSFHSSWLDRRGSRELIVDPLKHGDTGELLLSSEGSSRYRNVEVGFQYTLSTMLDVNVSYARSVGRSDFNAFANYFDTMMEPVIEPNAFGPAFTDVPHRLFLKAQLLPTPRWLFYTVTDWRTGLPYSAVNESLEFVGARNSLRFPNRALVDLGLEHRFKIGKFEPWIGLAAYNAFNKFLPNDVQNNLGSPNFGALYNSPFRQFRLQIRFER